MKDFSTYLIMGFAAALIIFLLYVFLKMKEGEQRTGSSNQTKKLTKKQLAERQANASAKGLLVTCPLCNSPLQKGEDLITRVYRPMNVPDQLCTINGCPHCYPRTEPGLRRECPVCHKNVPLDSGHLIARLFNKTEGKKHVIVTGCSECSRGAK